MIPVVLSGGSGTRLWPVSRTSLPKQFAELFDESLITKTLRRLLTFGSPWVVTVNQMKVLTERVFRELNLSKEQILLEPTGKNTAPAIALLCKVLEQKKKDSEIVGIFPADHLIQNDNAFTEALRIAEKSATQGYLVTLGIQPSYPSTGYGYIETLSESSGTKILQTQGFKEKPTTEAAERMIATGRYFWNAGIFIFKVAKMVEYFKTFYPKIWDIIDQLKPDLSNLVELYPQIESISIDYAIAEKVKEQVCVPVEMGWSDVGSWDEVSKIKRSALDQMVEIDSKENFVFPSPHQKKIYAFVGVENLILVDTQDCLLLAKRGHTQKVKEVVQALERQNKKEAKEHSFEYRPWGKFEVLRDTQLFKSKLITVEPGHQLSYQSHSKRAEHWIIIQGYPDVVLNDHVIQPKPGESVYIPMGAKHRIKNPGTEPVLFVEVQVGEYFGEDDIVRYQDDYKRI